MKTIRIAANATTAKLYDADEDAKLEVNRLLSYRVDGADHMAAVQGGHWDGRSSFFHFNEGVFPAGFVHHVTAGLRKAGYEIQLVRAPLPAPLGPELADIKLDGFGYDPRYDYQPNTVTTLLRHGQIVARVATGGGKSRIARLAMARINRRTLFLTTRSILMYQMHTALEEQTGAPVAVLGDGEWGIPYTKPDGSPGRKLSKFNVGMVQTLAARLKGPDSSVKGEALKAHQARVAATLTVLEQFEFVILEEAHETSSESFWTIMANCKNARYRLALTATPHMKDDEEANMRLLGASGPIAVDISEKMLIDRGILARPYFKFIKLDEAKKPKRLYKSTPYQGAYTYGITENEHRNRLLVAEVTRGVHHGLSAMVLVQRKDHGKILQALFERVGVKSAYIFGEDDAKKRRKTILQLERGEIQVLIGSTILDVGVDVPAVGMIALAGGGKAEVGTRQRIGRGLRAKKVGPNVALVIDFADDFNNHLKGHAKERRTIIEQTPGFVEGIVKDFDYRALGLARVAA